MFRVLVSFCFAIMMLMPVDSYANDLSSDTDMETPAYVYENETDEVVEDVDSMASEAVQTDVYEGETEEAVDEYGSEEVTEESSSFE